MLSPMSVISRLWVIVMAGSLLGQILGGAEGRSNILEGLVTGYLRDEGQVEIEGRTIVYKATVKGFSFPVVFDATATDSATGITATAENFDDPQDAYHKAVANLLAILRQRGLMKDQMQRTEPDSMPPKVEPKPPLEPEQTVDKSEPSPSPMPLPEHEDPAEPSSKTQTEPTEESSVSNTDVTHEQPSKPDSIEKLDLEEIEEPNLNAKPNLNLEPDPELELTPDPEINRTPGEDGIGDAEKQRPLPDHQSKKERSDSYEKDLEHEKEEPNADRDGQLNERGWAGWLFQLGCTLAIATLVMFFQYPPLKAIGVVGILVVGASVILGLNVFKTGLLAIVTLVIIAIIQANFKRATIFVLKTVKSLQNLLAVIQPAGFLLEVTPDYQGSYADYKMKLARPTEEMLSHINNYKLWSQCKGLAFVLNNVKFSRGERVGSDIDLKNMVHLFKELGYKIILHNDLEGKDILTSFQEFAAMFNQEDARYDSAVVVLMSHGDTGVILGTDLVQVKIRDLQRELERDKCPGLEGKPKMYFVQACRGNLSPTQPVEPDGPNDPCDNPGSSRLRHELLQVQPDNYFARKIWDVADVHFAFATTEGHLSLRSEVIGSFFVQALCEVFFAYAHQDNLDTLMNKVTNRVNRRRGKLFDHESGEWIVVNQTPECVKRMRKALYFLPKYSQKP